MTKYVKSASTVMLEWIKQTKCQSNIVTGEDMSLNDRLLNERLEEWTEYFEKLKERERAEEEAKKSSEKNQEKSA